MIIILLIQYYCTIAVLLLYNFHTIIVLLIVHCDITHKFHMPVFLQTRSDDHHLIAVRHLLYFRPVRREGSVVHETEGEGRQSIVLYPVFRGLPYLLRVRTVFQRIFFFNFKYEAPQTLLYKTLTHFHSSSLVNTDSKMCQSLLICT